MGRGASGFFFVLLSKEITRSAHNPTHIVAPKAFGFLLLCVYGRRAASPVAACADGGVYYL